MSGFSCTGVPEKCVSTSIAKNGFNRRMIDTEFSATKNTHGLKITKSVFSWYEREIGCGGYKGTISIKNTGI